MRSSAATVSSWCDALAAHHKCGSVFSARFCPFQADINFSHGSVAAQIWNAFPLPFLSPPLLLGIIFILPSSFAAGFWSEWGFCARPLPCHQLAAFRAESLMVWCLCHPLYTHMRITVLGSGQPGAFLGRILQKRKYCPTAFCIPEEKNRLVTERTSRLCLNILSCSWKREMGLSLQ